MTCMGTCHPGATRGRNRRSIGHRPAALAKGPQPAAAAAGAGIRVTSNGITKGDPIRAWPPCKAETWRGLIDSMALVGIKGVVSMRPLSQPSDLVQSQFRDSMLKLSPRFTPSPRSKCSTRRRSPHMSHLSVQQSKLLVLATSTLAEERSSPSRGSLRSVLPSSSGTVWSRRRPIYYKLDGLEKPRATA
jgi:hypothetical protein